MSTIAIIILMSYYCDSVCDCGHFWYRWTKDGVREC